MGRLLSLFGGWQGYLASAAVAALLATGATYYVTSLSYRVTISHMEAAAADDKADRTALALAQFTADADKIHEAADAYSALQTGLDTRFSAITKDFANAIKSKPLDPACRPDPIRVRSLIAAVDAANSATGLKPGPAVPPAQ